VPRICAWYEQAGFEVVWVSEPDRSYGVGVCRFTGTRSVPLPTGRLFAFSG
jgi:hypothetical protein